GVQTCALPISLSLHSRTNPLHTHFNQTIAQRLSKVTADISLRFTLYSYHESTLIIFYNNDMLWCTDNTVIRIFVSALSSASPTLQTCSLLLAKKVQDSQCSAVVFAINGSRRSCKLIIPCRLNRWRSYKNSSWWNNGSWRSQRTLSLR